RGTSGALLFARTAETAAALGRAFEAGKVDKRCLALVRGTPPESGVIDYPIPKTEDGGDHRAIARGFRVRADCAEAVARPPMRDVGSRWLTMRAGVGSELYRTSHPRDRGRDGPPSFACTS